MVRVHYEEGIASHIAPEPCAGIREEASEASAGECVGQPWSHERVDIPDAGALQYVEGNTSGHDIASACRSGVVVEPGMHASALHGRREISRLTWRSSGIGQARAGKARSRSR